MKKLTLSLLTAFAVASPSFAGTTIVTSSKEYKQPVVAEPCFRDHEFGLDLFYSFNDARPGHNRYYRDGSGGGVGLSYFFTRYVGLDLEGNWWDGIRAGDAHDNDNDHNGNDRHNGREIAHQVTSNLILRYPIESGSFCWAPYIFGGGGGLFDGQAAGFGDAGAGVEFRVAHNVGLFADWRWNFVGRSRSDESTSRAGIRFVF